MEQIPDACLERISALSLGEPNLHPHLDAVVAGAASRRPTDLFLATNGLSLRDQRAAVARLLTAGLRHVHFSAEGADAIAHGLTAAGRPVPSGHCRPAATTPVAPTPATR